MVSLGAPPVDEADLATAWKTLATWAAEHSAERRRQQPELEATASARQQQVTVEIAALTRLLSEHSIPGVSDPARAPAAVTEHRVRAENALAAVRRDREKAATLDAQIRGRREEEQVATKLGQLLRATSFERWLCSEALDSLVEEASVTLMELSGGQYQLDRDDRNDLVVIDYEDAGARRPVHTLSGGETFQASLALALALSRQVVGLSAGMRDLNSMFLDEGFGTLDEDTLETVATTLERLAADSDRMVGIITHVAALADGPPSALWSAIPARHPLCARNAYTTCPSRFPSPSRLIPGIPDTGWRSARTSTAAPWGNRALNLTWTSNCPPSSGTPSIQPGTPLPGTLLFLDGVRRIDARVWVMAVPSPAPGSPHPLRPGWSAATARHASPV